MHFFVTTSPVTHKQIKITYALLKANMTRPIVGGVQILDMVGNLATIAQWWQDVSRDKQERCQAMSHCGQQTPPEFHGIVICKCTSGVHSIFKAIYGSLCIIHFVWYNWQLDCDWYLRKTLVSQCDLEL